MSDARLGEAYALHQAGRFAEAANAYDPKHFDASLWTAPFAKAKRIQRRAEPKARHAQKQKRPRSKDRGPLADQNAYQVLVTMTEMVLP